METETQSNNPKGHAILKFLQNNPNGMTISDVVQHMSAESQCPATEQFKNTVEKLMDNGVCMGFLRKLGDQYYSWIRVPFKRQRRCSGRADSTKRRRYTEDEELETGRPSTLSAKGGKEAAPKRRKQGQPHQPRQRYKESELNRGRHGSSKDDRSGSRTRLSDDEREPGPRPEPAPRRRRRRARRRPVVCYYAPEKPRLCQRNSLSSLDASRSSSTVE